MKKIGYFVAAIAFVLMLQSVKFFVSDTFARHPCLSYSQNFAIYLTDTWIVGGSGGCENTVVRDFRDYIFELDFDDNPSVQSCFSWLEVYFKEYFMMKCVRGGELPRDYNFHSMNGVKYDTLKEAGQRLVYLSKSRSLSDDLCEIYYKNAFYYLVYLASSMEKAGDFSQFIEVSSDIEDHVFSCDKVKSVDYIIYKNFYSAFESMINYDLHSSAGVVDGKSKNDFIASISRLDEYSDYIKCQKLISILSVMKSNKIVN